MRKTESPTSLDWVAGKMVMSVLLLNISVAPYSLQDKT